MLDVRGMLSGARAEAPGLVQVAEDVCEVAIPGEWTARNVGRDGLSGVVGVSVVDALVELQA